MQPRQNRVLFFRELEHGYLQWEIIFICGVLIEMLSGMKG